MSDRQALWFCDQRHPLSNEPCQRPMHPLGEGCRNYGSGISWLAERPIERESGTAAELLRKIHPDRFCPCGAPRSVAPPFHRRSTNHECVHHPRYRCWTCKGADRLIAGAEARLWAEAEHGPFIV